VLTAVINNYDYLSPNYTSVGRAMRVMWTVQGRGLQASPLASPPSTIVSHGCCVERKASSFVERKDSFLAAM
jgi:hypothetical protein